MRLLRILALLGADDVRYIGHIVCVIVFVVLYIHVCMCVCTCKSNLYMYTCIMCIYMYACEREVVHTCMCMYREGNMRGKREVKPLEFISIL